MPASSFPDERKAEFLRLLEAGESRTAACRALKITLGAVRYAIANDEGFADALELIEAERDDEVVDALHKSAVEDRNVNAIKFWLKNRRRNDWADRTVVTRESGGESPMQFSISITAFLGEIMQNSPPEVRAQLLPFIAAELPPVSVDDDVLELEEVAT